MLQHELWRKYIRLNKVSLKEPRRTTRQRERHQTKGLMISTIAVDLHCAFLIRPQQNEMQREMTLLWVQSSLY